MLREKPLRQDNELKIQRQQFSKSSKEWCKLKRGYWWTETPQRCFRSCWFLSQTVWVIMQVQTMGRNGKMTMTKRQSKASSAKMTNPAGWWAQSQKWYSSAWRGFGRSRWSFTHWHNLDWRTQPTTSVTEIRSKAHPISENWQSLNCKGMMVQLYLHLRNLESLRSVLTLSL